MATATTARRKPTSKGSQHPLADRIPSKVKADDYVSRTINGVQDLDLLRYARKVGKSVLFTGHTGTGKTHLMEAYAAAEGIPLIVVECRDGIDPNTFFGQWVPNPSGTGARFIWQDSEIVTAIRHGNAAILLDEVNFARPKVTASFHNLLRNGNISILEKGNENIVAGPGLLIAAAFNDGYEGTHPLNAAFKNRFAIKVTFKYDPEVEGQLVCMPVLLELAGKLRAQQEDGTLETPVSTNMLVEFEELAMDISLEFATENFVAAFTEDEKSAVKEAMALHMDRIDEQLKEMAAIAGEA